MTAPDMRDARAGAATQEPSFCMATKRCRFTYECKLNGECARQSTVVAITHADIYAMQSELAAANAAIRERDERLTEIAKLARSCVWNSMAPTLNQIIALAEMRAEAEHE